LAAVDESYYAVQGRPKVTGGPWHYYKNDPRQETALGAIDSHDFLARTVPTWEFRIVFVRVEVILPPPAPPEVPNAQ
jgi:hypothetical protein